MRKNVIIALLALLALLPAFTACNTMQGLGEDLQKGGENLSNAASRNK
jgi:predicted small secreted protein